MKPPYPLELVPLLLQFLQRRRTRFTFPLRVIEELGIDRPAFSFVLSLHAASPDGTRPGDLTNPYVTVFDGLRTTAAVAMGAGLAEEWRDGWRLTAKGRELAQRTRREGDAYLASLDLMPPADLAKLADALTRGFQATSAALEPRWHEHLPRAARAAGDASRPMVRLENTVYGLWQVRDDCHMAAWKTAGLDGPTLDTLTRIWRSEAATEGELAKLLAQQRPPDVSDGLAQLRRDGLIVAGEPLATTEHGRTMRQGIEDETDRRFFAPWPDDVGAMAPWLCDRLAFLNEALAATA